MDRVSCPHCQKQFKGESGLAYHLAWAHKSPPEDDQSGTSKDAFTEWLTTPYIPPAEKPEEDQSGLVSDDEFQKWLASPADRPTEGPAAEDAKSLTLQQLPSPKERAELLKQIQQALAELNEQEREQAALIIEQVQSATIESHRHGMADPNCPTCNQVVGASLEKARAEEAAIWEAVPGARELRTMWEADDDDNTIVVSVTPE